MSRRIIQNIKTALFLMILMTVLSGCSSHSVPLEEKIRQEYVNNHRLDRFYELQKKYDNTKVVLYINEESDAMWITNFSIWLIFTVLPDLPESLAVGGVVGIIYFFAWWLGVTLCGGGILAVLAYVGTMLGVIPGIPPAIAGIIFLCTMFALLENIFKILF